MVKAELSRLLMRVVVRRAERDEGKSRARSKESTSRCELQEREGWQGPSPLVLRKCCIYRSYGRRVCMCGKHRGYGAENSADFG